MAQKHKNVKNKPIIQLTPIEYFSKDKETIPLWLKNYKKGEKVNVSSLFDSRIVYYPGSATDGSPIRLFNASHSAHVFVYVDYGYDREKIEAELSDDAFLGYHLYHQQNVSQKELSPHTPRYHVTEEEMRFAISGYDMSINPKEGFAILKIYERNEDYGDEHGAFRFAILYIGADANATYDALFGNTSCSPYACVVCANMGSGYTCFVRYSLLESIAQRTDRFPKYLLCMQDYGWDGYSMLRSVKPNFVGGSKRFIWEKNNGIPTLDGLDEDLKNIIVFE